MQVRLEHPVVLFARVGLEPLAQVDPRHVDQDVGLDRARAVLDGLGSARSSAETDAVPPSSLDLARLALESFGRTRSENRVPPAPAIELRDGEPDPATRTRYQASCRKERKGNSNSIL